MRKLEFAVLFGVISLGLIGFAGSAFAANIWTLQSAGTGHDLWGIAMVDANTGLVAGGGGIFKTTDGGTTWIQVNPQGQALWNLTMVDANIGWAIGSGGTILKTTDGGTTWSAQSGAPFLSMRSVDCIDSSTCIITGDSGTILKTTDGSTTWIPLNSGVTTQYLNSVSFIDASNAIVVGYDGTILKTTDGGTTWIPQTSGTTVFLRSVDFLDISNGIATGDGVILKTTDGGITWTAASENTNQSLYDVQFIDTNNAIAVYSGSTILKSADGGTTWTSDPSGINNHQMHGVDFIDVDNGWVVGAVGNILKSATAPLISSTSLTMTNSTGGPGVSIPEGTTVTYDFYEENDGDTPLTAVDVTLQDLYGVTMCTTALVDGDTNNDGVLDAGETWHYTCDVTYNTPGYLRVLATGTGTAPDGEIITYPGDLQEQVLIGVDVYELPPTTLTLIKHSIGSGGDTFQIQNTNSSGTQIHNLLTFANEYNNPFFSTFNIAPGDSQSLSEVVPAGWKLTGQYCNINGVDVPANSTTFIPALGDNVFCTFTNEILINSTFLTVTNSTGGPGVSILEGTTVTYDFYEENDGETPLTAVDVTLQDLYGVTMCTTTLVDGDTNTDGILDAGETWHYTCDVTYNTPGYLRVLATGTGTAPDGEVITYPGDLEERVLIGVDVTELPPATLTISQQAYSGIGTFSYQHTNSSGIFNPVIFIPFNELYDSLFLGSITPGDPQSLSALGSGGAWRISGEYCSINGVDIPGNVTSFTPSAGDNVYCKFTHLTDSDGDGIVSNIDPLHLDPTNFTFDDGVTSGTVIPGDQILTIFDLPFPDGVGVISDVTSGPTSATITDCEGTIYTITPGDNIVVTCGSSIVQVNQGPVEIGYFVDGSEFATTTLDSGDDVTFEQDTLTFTNNGESIIEIIIDGDTVTVTPGDTVVISDDIPRTLKQNAKVELSEFVVDDRKDQKKINKADRAIRKSLNDKLWEDDSTLTKNGKKVFIYERYAVKQLLKVKSVDTSSIIEILVAADQILAQSTIDSVPTDTGNKKIDRALAKANKQMNEALGKLENGKPDQAISKYLQAWTHAQHALNHVQKNNND